MVITLMVLSVLEIKRAWELYTMLLNTVVRIII